MDRLKFTNALPLIRFNMKAWGAGRERLWLTCNTDFSYTVTRYHAHRELLQIGLLTRDQKLRNSPKKGAVFMSLIHELHVVRWSLLYKLVSNIYLK